MTDQASTPPHHPSYNVRLSPGRVNHIVSTLYPNHIANIREAQRGQSYNNRIYYLDIYPNASSSTSALLNSQQAVLKVSGHFFNQTKIQNEVASLLLLTRHCPTIPVPVLLGWSEDGRTISTYKETVPDASSVLDQTSHGWILMSRIPGRILTNDDLDGPSGESLLADIAKFNTGWRTDIPHVPMFGNIRNRLPHEAPPGSRSANPPPFEQAYTVGGFILTHRYDPTPITSKLAYYNFMAKDQLHRVMTNRAYDDVRCDLVPLIADFLERDLPDLHFVQQAHNETTKAVFTHMDLAPRNILVDERPDGRLKITGMIDFEFAAFLPELDEFTNAYVRQEDDWQPRHYKVLMHEMAKLGAKVPPVDGVKGDSMYSKQEWQEVRLLWRLIDNIAPWYIMDGRQSKLELEKILDKAGRTIQDCIRQLQEIRSKGKDREVFDGVSGVGRDVIT